jgi:hypothetical protein
VILSPFNADKVFRIHNDQYRIFGQVGEYMIALRLPTVSFGAVSAIVTSIGLIIGFGAAGISKSTILPDFSSSDLQTT